MCLFLLEYIEFNIDYLFISIDLLSFVVRHLSHRSNQREKEEINEILYRFLDPPSYRFQLYIEFVQRLSSNSL